MKIGIENGAYTKDEAAAGLLTRTEEEYLAALAQKLVIRQDHKKTKELEAQERERIRAEKLQEKERLRLEKQKEQERKERDTINRLFLGNDMSLPANGDTEDMAW